MKAVNAPGLAAAVPSLRLLLSGLARRSFDVQAFDAALASAAARRPVMDATHVLLPEGDRGYAGWRAAVAHVTAHLRYSQPRRASQGLKPLGVAVISALEDARVERLLLREYPGLRRWFLDLLPDAPSADDLSFAALMTRLDRALLDPRLADDNHWVNKGRDLFEAAAERGLDDYQAFRAIASVLANDLGQMRVRFEPQAHAVSMCWRDDNSWLWDHGLPDTPPEEALDLDVRTQVSLAPPADARDASDAQPLGGAPELETGRFSYPEWNRRSERLRPDWCTVIEKLPAWQDARSAQADGVSPPVAGWFAPRRARRLSRRRPLRRQWEGEDIDLNAAVEVQVDRRLRLQPEPRMFTRPGCDLASNSILVLLDLSESANDRLRAAGVSLLDLEKQAALALGGVAAQPGGDRIAIHGFSSNTRAEVYYMRLLDFGMPFTPQAGAMIRSVRARYSTRMGAALRHATALLRAETSARRAILIVTDGAPADLDVPDPRDLIEDARMAVLEARREGVRSYCIAVDSAADAYVRRIFGWRDHAIADDPATLASQLRRAWERLAAG